VAEEPGPTGSAEAALVTVSPRPLEVALAWLLPGALIQIAGRPGPERVPSPLAEVPGSEMGYGAYLLSYWGPRSVGIGRRRWDRPMWAQAGRQLEAGGRGSPVLYVVHEPADWYGRPVLKATRIRREGEE
jgi:hypothetical protein